MLMGIPEKSTNPAVFANVFSISSLLSLPLLPSVAHGLLDMVFVPAGLGWMVAGFGVPYTAIVMQKCVLLNIQFLAFAHKIYFEIYLDEIHLLWNTTRLIYDRYIIFIYNRYIICS